MRIEKSKQGYTHLWLSANDTHNWANRVGASWPCSALSSHRLYAEFDKDGDLIDMAIDGKSKDCPADEFNAITSDFLQ